ncbi:dihydroorotase [bacterium SCSIO 12741]|nr:dihydroorotase [bacterium SCSIO 12741]
MNLLIRKARIVDPQSDLNGKVRDILIKNGTIEQIGQKLENPDGKIKEYSASNLHVSPGWFDMSAHMGEPGLEERETLATGVNAAVAGGYTHVAVLPNNDPASDTAVAVSNLVQRGQNTSINLHPIGTLSKGLGGEDLAEMYDMTQAGAIAFSDDLHPVKNAKFQQLAQEYARNFDGLVFSFPMDPNIQGKGNVHEGGASTLAGLKGIPHLAEEIVVERDLSITEYTEGKLHFTGISSAGSLDRIQKARKRGLQVTCDVPVANLVLNEDVLLKFDSNYKVMPPIRSEKDRKALVKGIQKGQVDAISSHHRPQNIENKACEFESAKYGMIGLQTTFSLCRTYLEELSLDELIQVLSIGPRKVYNQNPVAIQEGQEANITLFDPDKSWTYTEKNNRSLAENSPFLGEELKGLPLGVFTKNKLVLNPEH